MVIQSRPFRAQEQVRALGGGEILQGLGRFLPFVCHNAAEIGLQLLQEKGIGELLLGHLSQQLYQLPQGDLRWDLQPQSH